MYFFKSTKIEIVAQKIKNRTFKEFKYVPETKFLKKRITQTECIF